MENNSEKPHKIQKKKKKTIWDEKVALRKFAVYFSEAKISYTKIKFIKYQLKYFQDAMDK